MVGLKTIIITGMVTGSISIICSLTIIVLILRSTTRLSDIFHRIMVGLSLADITLSVAMSFGTVPSPKGDYAVDFARGDTSTCNVQGFFYLFGAASAPLYAITLQLYFLLRIKYDIAKESIVKNVEPFLHAAPIAYGMVAAIVPLMLGSINPTGWTSCYIVEYPSGCKSNISEEIALIKKETRCVRGDKVDPRILRWLFFCAPHIIIFISLCITSWMMYFAMREIELRTATFLPIDPTLRATWIEERRLHENSQKIIKRAVSYLTAFALSFMNAMIFGIITWVGVYNSMFHLFVYIFFPLHGLFNLIVFLWPKVIQVREENENLSPLKNIIIAIRTYNRESLITLGTNDHEVSSDDEDIAPLNGNSVSSSKYRISLTGWLQRLLRQKKISGQNTKRSFDRQDVNKLENDGSSHQPINDSDCLNASCPSLNDSDVISFNASESASDEPNTSCQSLEEIQAIDGISVGESESESESEKSSV